MGFSQSHPQANPSTARLVFHDALAQVDRDPQHLAERLAQHYSLVDFGPRPGTEANFLHRTSTSPAGELLLSCGYTSPLLGTIGERPEVGSINLIFSGGVVYESQGQEFAINPNRPFFFSPGDRYTYLVKDHFNGVVFNIDMKRLRRTAAAIAGLGVSERRFTGDLDHSKSLYPATSRTQQLMKVLYKTFSLLDHPELQKIGDLDHLQIDDLIYRNLALLLCPRLEQLSQVQQQGLSGRERVFEDLLEWILANLQQPLNLSQLEQRSGYSRRNLQLAFQQRFGCGPIQWVRQQRLEQARADLLNPRSDDTVAGIAARYGFSSLSVFSRDFCTRYGLRPSDLLREGRRHPA